MNNTLMTLSYRSLARLRSVADDLQQITRGSRVRNAALNITGFLVFDGVHFLQTLEGPVEPIGTIFQRIMDDPRHIEVVPFDVKVIDRRRFADWDMHLFDERESNQLAPDLALTDFSDFWLSCVHDRAARALLERGVAERHRMSLQSN